MVTVILVSLGVVCQSDLDTEKHMHTIKIPPSMQKALKHLTSLFTQSFLNLS